MVTAIRSMGKNNNNFRNLTKTVSQIVFFFFSLQSCFISSKWQYMLTGMYISNAAVLKHGPRILDTRFHLELESMSPPLACAIRFVMTLTERLTVRPLKLRETKKFLSGPQEIHSWDATTIPWVSEWKSLGCVWFFVTPWTVATRLLCPCNSPGKNTGVGWASVPFSRGSFQPRDCTQVSHIAGRFFTIWATREAQWEAQTCPHREKPTQGLKNTMREKFG